MFNAKRSVMYAWIVSYIIIFFIPVIVSASIYPISRNMLEKQINDANQTLLNQVQYAIDGRLQDIEKIAYEITANPAVKGLHYLNSDADKALQYNVVMQYLRGYKMTNSFLDNIYVVMNDQSGALTYDTFVPHDLFADRLKRYTSWTSHQWSELLVENPYDKFQAICKTGAERSVCEAVVLTKTLPTYNQNRSFGQLMLFMDSSKFLEPMQNIQWVEGGQLLIMDDSDNIVASTSPISDSVDYKSFQKGAGGFHARYDERDWTVSYVTSGISNWKYISLIPTKVIKEKLDYIRDLTIAGLLLSFTLGGILTYFFIRRNYNPLSSLIRGITHSDGLFFDKKYNEYEFIQQAIIKSTVDKEKTNQVLRKQKDLLKSNDLTQWLKGNWIDPARVDELFADRIFSSSLFRIMAFHIDEHKMSFKLAGKENRLKEELRLARFVISNTAMDVASSKYEVVGTEVDEKIVFIINQKNDQSDNDKEDMMTIAKEIKAFVDEKYNIPYSTAISNAKSDIHLLPAAYKEALDAIEYNLILSISGISFYDDIINLDNTKSEEWVYFSSLRAGRKLINFIKTGDTSQAQATLDEMFELHHTASPLSVPAVKLMKLNLTNTMINILFEVSPFIEDSFLQELNPVRRLLNCQQIAEVKLEMSEILVQLCGYIILNRKEESSELKDAVIGYLERNYGDPELSVSLMGSHFGMTPTYLSRLFKEQTGVGLLDYMIHFRLEKAKELLKQDQLSINHISNQVGFASTNTFIRAFKKYEGITPGKYRSITAESID
ncbi:AraC family transcriptional regulator [Cohnella endophytica]|uniref:AraC family transcriptional regulator n=1 Tax=Cohnella endophytica TaxID=2419778 RepID=A0A494XP37_9BACL|nr:AraC family transcriptional regulator [Cohnella endophytica]RKP49899.1 AraC family transcriptional regulator [Cohnella endophytica]